MTITTATLTSFLPARIVRRIEQDPSGCWLWTGPLNSNGYGLTTRPNSKRHVVVHRLVYELAGNEIPEGLQLAAPLSRPQLREPGPPRARHSA